MLLRGVDMTLSDLQEMASQQKQINTQQKMVVEQRGAASEVLEAAGIPTPAYCFRERDRTKAMDKVEFRDVKL